MISHDFQKTQLDVSLSSSSPFLLVDIEQLAFLKLLSQPPTFCCGERCEEVLPPPPFPLWPKEWTALLSTSYPIARPLPGVEKVNSSRHLPAIFLPRNIKSDFFFSPSGEQGRARHPLFFPSPPSVSRGNFFPRREQRPSKKKKSSPLLLQLERKTTPFLNAVVYSFPVN